MSRLIALDYVWLRTATLFIAGRRIDFDWEGFEGHFGCHVYLFPFAYWPTIYPATDFSFEGTMFHLVVPFCFWLFDFWASWLFAFWASWLLAFGRLGFLLFGRLGFLLFGRLDFLLFGRLGFLLFGRLGFCLLGVLAFFCLGVLAFFVLAFACWASGS